MARTTMTAAVNEALREEMRRDPRVFLMGIDVEIGIMGRTKGLVEEFGAHRVRNTPISEIGFLGAGVGAAAAGMVPVVDLMMANFMYVAMDQIVNQAGKLPYMMGGSSRIPLTMLCGVGAPGAIAAQHSDSPYAQVINAGGVKVVVPSTAEDAKGLLKSAIRDPNPVLFMVHFALGAERGSLPDGEVLLPLGKARVLREGGDLTIVAWGMMAKRALAAARVLEQQGISAEVVDPRTLYPFDYDAVYASLEKTGRLLVVDEAHRTCSVGSEVIARVAVERHELLRGAPRIVANPDTHVPYAPELEAHVIPQVDDIVAAALATAQPAGAR